MPKKVENPMKSLPQSGQGDATAEEMAKRFPGMFEGLGPEDMKPSTAGPPAGSASRGMAPPGGRPPEGARTIDFGNRTGFENEVFSQIGGNPFDLDPYEFLEQADASLPDIFNQVFQGQVIWSDRDKLDKDQTKFWNSVVKQFHAHVFDRATSMKQIMTDKYNFMMNRFDNEKKAKDASLKRIQAQTKAPETRNLVNPEGKLTMHQWDRKKEEWIDTGKGTTAPKEPGRIPPIVTTAITQVTKAAKAISPEMAIMIGLNKDLPNQPWFQSMMNAKASPEMQPFLARQWEIINSFYGLGEDAESIGDPAAAEKVRKGKAGKAKAGAAGKAKTRIKMDKEGNIIQ